MSKVAASSSSAVHKSALTLILHYLAYHERAGSPNEQIADKRVLGLVHCGTLPVRLDLS